VGFNVGDAFNWGWTKFTQNWSVFVVAALIYVAIIFVVQIIVFFIFRGIFLNSTPSITVNQQTGEITTTGGTGFFASLVFGAVFTLFFLFVGAFLQAAFVRGALSIANGQQLELGTMFRFDDIGNVVVGAIVVAIATGIGYLFCLVGALVVWFFTAFWLFFVLDKRQSGWDGVVSSVRFVNGHLGTVFLLLLGALVAWIIGIFTCGIGLIITAPVALLALTYGFRRIQNEPLAA
jgi:uncharacterized membrane protein